MPAIAKWPNPPPFTAGKTWGAGLVGYIARHFQDLGERINRKIDHDEPPVSNQTASFTAADDRFYTVNTTAGNITITLPAAADSRGMNWIFFKTVAANNMIVDPTGAETVNGAATLTVAAQYGWAWVFCDGTQFWALS